MLILHADAFSYEPISELLQWSPTVVVTAEALPAVVPWQFHVDWVLAPEGTPRAEIQTWVEPMEVGFHFYRTWAAVAGIDLLTSRGITDVSVFVSEGVDFAPFENGPLRCTLFSGGTRWNHVREGSAFRKWLPDRARVSIRGDAAVTEGALAHQTTVGEGWLGLTGRGSFWVGEPW